jgi:hypothetical protein
MFEVVNSFIDLDTGKKHLSGSEYKAPSKKRGKELLKLGFLKEVEKDKLEKGDSDESESAK